MDQCRIGRSPLRYVTGKPYTGDVQSTSATYTLLRIVIPAAMLQGVVSLLSRLRISNSQGTHVNSRSVWLLPQILIVFGLVSAAVADVRKPALDAKLTVQKAPEAEERPRISYLKTWYERRGNYDVVHVTNLGTTPAVWSGRIYEDGKGCLCMAPNMCTVGPACTNPNGGDTRAYAGAHSCMAILSITESQDVAQCVAK